MKAKTIAIATALTTLLSGSAVMANTTNSDIEQAPKLSQTQTCEGNGWFKSHLDSLVASGALTKAQDSDDKSAITKVSKDGVKGEFNRGHHKGEFKTVLAGLVKDGTITQDQVDAIKSAMKAAKEVNTTKADFKTVLDGLVNDGTITQVQEDAIKRNSNTHG